MVITRLSTGFIVPSPSGLGSGTIKPLQPAFMVMGTWCCRCCFRYQTSLNNYYTHLDVDIANQVIAKVVANIHLINRTIGIFTLYEHILQKQVRVTIPT